jgi:hypothetical protein
VSSATDLARKRIFVCVCVAGLMGGLGLVELGFRWMLFGTGAAERVGGNLRHAVYYADPASEDDFWKLFLVLDRTQPPVPAKAYHPELGWVSQDLDAATLAHSAAGQVGTRRPVLLYGDSFARCMGDREDCFESLLAGSDLSDRYFLLNHGVQGFGLDQIHLLIDRTVDRYLEQRPVVVVALQIDDSLDRTVLSLRGWPKPRLRVVGDALVIEQTPIPSIEQYLAERPLHIFSYGLRYLVHGAHVLPRRTAAWIADGFARTEEKQALDRSILAALVDGLRRRQCEFFLLLFYGEPYLSGAKAPDWREALLLDFCRGHSVPLVSARRAVLEDSARSGRPIADYFDQTERESRGHFLPLGNAAAFRALRDGIEGRFERL